MKEYSEKCFMCQEKEEIIDTGVERLKGNYYKYTVCRLNNGKCCKCRTKVQVEIGGVHV